MERRQFPRVTYGAWVEDKTQEGGLRFYLAKDLSMGGILLQAGEPPQIGSHVVLKLIVENEPRTVSLEGEVIRHMQTGSGAAEFAVRFINLDDTRRTFLEELIAECQENK